MMSDLKEKITENKEFIFILITAFVFNLSRRDYLIQSDAYIVIWMAKAMEAGWYDAWTLHPFSPFGQYPYSLYPVGVPFIISLFLRSGVDVHISIKIYSMLVVLVGFSSSYHLSKTIFNNQKEYQYWFIFFFIFGPMFIDRVRGTCSVRGLFLALLPYALNSIIKFLQSPNFKSISHIFISFLSLALTHAIIIGYFIYFLAGVAIIIIGYTQKRFSGIEIRKIPYLIILSAYAIILLISIGIFGVKGFSSFSHEIIGYGDLNIWTNILNLGLHTIFSYGIILIFAAIGLINELFNHASRKSNIVNDYFIILGFFLATIVPYIDYSLLFVYPWVVYYASISIKIIKDRLKENIFKILTFWVIIIHYIQRIGLMSMDIIYLLFISSIVIFLIVISLFQIKFKPEKIQNLSKIMKRKEIFAVFIILLMIPLNSPLPDELTIEEIEIADFLMNHNKEGRLIVCNDGRIARRIAAIGFQPVIGTGNDPALLYYNVFGMNKELILENTNFDLNSFYQTGIPWRTTPSAFNFGYFEVYRTALYLDLTKMDDYLFAIEQNIGYVVIDKTKSEYGLNHINENAIILFSSVQEVGILRYSKNDLELYEIGADFIKE